METRLKTAEDFTIPKAYTLQKAEYVKELDSFTLVLKHNLSGARILVFSNEDDNKVFSIGFRTPPKDSTGVPYPFLSAPDSAEKYRNTAKFHKKDPVHPNENF